MGSYSQPVLGIIMIYVCTIVSWTYHTDFIKLSTKVSGKNLMLENCRLEVRSGGYFSRTILFNQAEPRAASENEFV